MFRLLLLTALAGLAAAAPAPNNLQTSVQAMQSGSSVGGATLGSSSSGSASAGSQRVIQRPGQTQFDARASQAGAALQGGVAGAGTFRQRANVVTGTRGGLGAVTAFGNSDLQAAAVNGAATGVTAGGAGATQQLAQAGRTPAGRVNSRFNLNAAANVGQQAAVQGTGAAAGWQRVAVTARHVGPILRAGRDFRGVGTPALGGAGGGAMPGMPAGGMARMAGMPAMGGRPAPRRRRRGD